MGSPTCILNNQQENDISCEEGKILKAIKLVLEEDGYHYRPVCDFKIPPACQGKICIVQDNIIKDLNPCPANQLTFYHSGGIICLDLICPTSGTNDIRYMTGINPALPSPQGPAVCKTLLRQNQTPCLTNFVLAVNPSDQSLYVDCQ